MIDGYAVAGTFADRHKLAQDLAKAVMKWENVPPINLFKKNTAAFIHELASEAISNAAGGSNYVRVQVLTPISVLNREKQLDVVRELTDIVGAAAGDPTLVNRTWMLITEAAEGGWESIVMQTRARKLSPQPVQSQEIQSELKILENIIRHLS
jgi:uncharacterized protein (DUF2336 family)